MIVQSYALLIEIQKGVLEVSKTVSCRAAPSWNRMTKGYSDEVSFRDMHAYMLRQRDERQIS